MMALVNGNRAGAGLQMLEPNLLLYIKASKWSSKMASEGKLSHSHLPVYNVYPWRDLGVNVGAFPGHWDMGSVNHTFMTSSHHRANIMNGSFQYFGIGVAWDAGGQMYMTQEFMQL
jgi:uncharacterized protein YkwD